MKNVHKVILAIYLLTLSIDSFGLTYIEPLIGVRLGSSEEFTSSGNEVSFDRSGIRYGARLGFSIFENFFLGGEFFLGEIDLEATTTSAGYADSSYDTTSGGIFLRHDITPLLHIWGSYHFMHKQEVTISTPSRSVGTVFFGNQYTLGVSCEPTSFYGNINIAYSIFKFDTVEFSNGTVLSLPNAPVGYDTKIAGSEFLLSISFPITLFE